MKEMLKNEAGNLSGTKTSYLVGGIIMAGILIYSVYLDRNYVPELFYAFGAYAMGNKISRTLKGNKE